MSQCGVCWLWLVPGLVISHNFCLSVASCLAYPSGSSSKTFIHLFTSFCDSTSCFVDMSPTIEWRIGFNNSRLIKLALVQTNQEVSSLFSALRTDHSGIQSTARSKLRDQKRIFAEQWDTTQAGVQQCPVWSIAVTDAADELISCCSHRPQLQLRAYLQTPVLQIRLLSLDA